MRRYLPAIVLVILGLGYLSAGCTKKDDRPVIWIYSALYPHVMNDLNTRLAKRFPNINFKWYQGGGEAVAAKIEAEALAGKIQPDILIAGDMFWYESLRSRGLLLKYDSPATKYLPLPYRDPDNTWASNRYAVCVIAYNSDVYNEKTAPKSFLDLADPKFKDKVSMASPLESGTAFTLAALLSKKYGWDYFQKLRANGIIVAGGNSSVISRIETKERPVGAVLLENILTSRKKNPKIMPVYPSDGAVVTPGPVGISATTPHPELAKQVYDWFFSVDAAGAAYNGDFYSSLPDAPPPAGAKPLTEVLKNSIPWTMDLIRGMKDEREPIKQRFSKIMFE